MPRPGRRSMPACGREAATEVTPASDAVSRRGVPTRCPPCRTRLRPAQRRGLSPIGPIKLNSKLYYPSAASRDRQGSKEGEGTEGTPRGPQGAEGGRREPKGPRGESNKFPKTFPPRRARGDSLIEGGAVRCESSVTSQTISPPGRDPPRCARGLQTAGLRHAARCCAVLRRSPPCRATHTAPCWHRGRKNATLARRRDGPARLPLFPFPLCPPRSALLRPAHRAA